MSIRCIDAQIMIVRSPDVLREAGALQKRSENAQDYLAISEKINGMQEQSKIAKTAAPEMPVIRADVGRGVVNSYKINEGNQKEGGYSQGEPWQDLLVAPSNNIIDIYI